MSSSTLVDGLTDSLVSFWVRLLCSHCQKCTNKTKPSLILSAAKFSTTVTTHQQTTTTTTNLFSFMEATTQNKMDKDFKVVTDCASLTAEQRINKIKLLRIEAKRIENYEVDRIMGFNGVVNNEISDSEQFANLACDDAANCDLCSTLYFGHMIANRKDLSDPYVFSEWLRCYTVKAVQGGSRDNATGGVYGIICTKGDCKKRGIVYVGSASNIRNRMGRHKKNITTISKDSYAIHRHFIDHGQGVEIPSEERLQHFSCVILEEVGQEQSLAREKYFMEERFGTLRYYGFNEKRAVKTEIEDEEEPASTYRPTKRVKLTPLKPMYYQIMLKCWQHDAYTRPSFADLSTRLLPECKPEQVQAIRDSERRNRRDQYLEYDAGDVITVLEKKPSQGSGAESDGLVWKGVLKDGRTGFFSPQNTITYLGSSFPTVKKSPFNRNDSRSSSLRSKGRISADMISGPQGDFKHTGHIGPEGQFFGDITFLSKSWVPRQVVPPYKPESISGSDTPGSDFSTPIARLGACSSSSSKIMQEIRLDGGDMASSSDTAPLLSTASQMNMDENDHEYHEISDEENEILSRHREEMGHSNPALSSKSQSPLDSPRFEKTFDLGGPSLIDEVFGALQQDHPDEAHNVKNELREMARSKKKFATVKPISSSDRKTLDHAIHLANELASRSMLDLDRPGKMSGASLDDISSSPRTPNSPSHKRKFSFILGGGGGGGRGERERRNYSQEAASIPDIQSTLSDEAKEAYNSLVEKPSLGALGFLTPSFENKSMSFHFPEKSSCSSKHSEFFELEPCQKSSNPDNLSNLGNHSSASNVPQHHHHSTRGSSSTSIVRKSKPRNLSLPDERMVMSLEEDDNNGGPENKMDNDEQEEEEVDGNPLRLLRQNKQAAGVGGSNNNVLPLPPRDRHKPVFPGGGGVVSAGGSSRHQRKHPLLIPSKISISGHSEFVMQQQGMMMPPPPPPKPVRQQHAIRVAEFVSNENDKKRETSRGKSDVSQKQHQQVDHDGETDGRHSFNSRRRSSENEDSSSVLSAVIESLKKNQPPTINNIADKVKLYENYESSEVNQQEEQQTDLLESVNANNNNSSVVVEPIPMKPRVPRGDSPLKTTTTSTLTNQTQINLNQSSSVHRRVASLDLSNSYQQDSSNYKSCNNFETNYHQPDHNLLKIRTVRRILGSSATEEECRWAVDSTNDAAHAVKLLRLKSLLPESLLLEDGVGNIVSALEMSHWDVALASAFLLDRDKARSKGGGSNNSSGRSKNQITRTGITYSTFVCNANFTTSDSTNNDSSNNNTIQNNGIETNNSNTADPSVDVNNEHVRPTRV